MDCHCHQCMGTWEPPEAQSLFPCAHCRYNIFSGDLYIQVKDKKYCMHCLEQLSHTELLHLLNEPILEA